MESLTILLIAIFIGLLVYVIHSRSETYNYHNLNPLLDKVRYNFSILNPAYGKIPLKEGDSAYTENKETITLCLKNPETGSYYDINTIMYVALHELGHMVTKSQGHNDEFRKNFSILLREGAKRGIYNPRKEIPQTYCGVGPDE